MFSTASQSRQAIASRRVKPNAVVYWSRWLSGHFAALLIFTLKLRGTVPVVGTIILVYAISSAMYKYVLKYDETVLKGPYKFASIGVGTFVATCLTTLVLIYTLFPY